MLSLCFYNCSSIKNIAPNQNLLVKERFVLDGTPLKQELTKQLSVFPPNTKLLGIPARLHIYNLASENSDSLFDDWLIKDPKRRDRLTRIYSDKQVEQLRNYKNSFNFC